LFFCGGFVIFLQDTKQNVEKDGKGRKEAPKKKEESKRNEAKGVDCLVETKTEMETRKKEK